MSRKSVNERSKSEQSMNEQSKSEKSGGESGQSGNGQNGNGQSKSAKSKSKKSKSGQSVSEQHMSEQSKNFCSGGLNLSRPAITGTFAVWTAPANLSSIKSQPRSPSTKARKRMRATQSGSTAYPESAKRR